MGRMAEIDANLRELPDYEKGVQVERERIIKLLETKHFPEHPMHSNRCPICKAVALITGEADYYEEETAWLDALIKGENK